MTWLGNPDAKPTDAKRIALETKREELVAKLKKMGEVKTFRFEHQKRMHTEDMTKVAKEITKIDQKLGRPVDRNSGV